jgi:ATP-dependent helicase HrpA
LTVHVPLSNLDRVSPGGFDWMVPGLLEELGVKEACGRRRAG